MPETSPKDPAFSHGAYAPADTYVFLRSSSIFKPTSMFLKCREKSVLFGLSQLHFTLSFDILPRKPRKWARNCLK
jgi:hypothetical protein